MRQGGFFFDSDSVLTRRDGFRGIPAGQGVPVVSQDFDSLCAQICRLRNQPIELPYFRENQNNAVKRVSLSFAAEIKNSAQPASTCRAAPNRNQQAPGSSCRSR